ncbi:MULTISPECIES: rRNA maturation RNase YbeY [Legionella]|uniref:Endoribonuclease YbeY n=1 Tax=Legionella septentrionalis TaxID=2498109 RepID=A0A433JL00_9GAMM|nr:MULTISPECIES: rRNA maturation RNase YbeY [Legionella]MCP0913500.1 rRNA maturation RNase YbeY [Legionella sp. 27cVA30]RUQ89725.1 rRNA maturation RNase YbeY [Legionella septentrionalis]RUQ99730.1 rRNA maturation RNase YbeY [Legionella septentrionalis]RUR11076.1 rRNA maturation RNase YbeY [Legionella septentrionalis]RUR15238.1 rRNA maturation RNase YbeY [Legionella septentrionalis]
MNYHVDIQDACATPLPVPEHVLLQWVELALSEKTTAELTLRFVDIDEMTHLNHTYRSKNAPTNVLAFPATLPQTIELELPLLGDVIICPAVLAQESQTLNKPLIAHWAHIVIHGTLHLLGYDHIQEEDACLMQAIETKLLAQLGFEDPYHAEENKN